MAPRPDELDRALIHALHVDGRAPFRRIGEVLGVSDQTAARRYARLRRDHGLRVVGLTTPHRTGEVQWMVRIRALPEAAADIAAALARRADTSWICLCAGGTEIVCTVYGDGVQPLLLDALPRTRHLLDVRADRVLHVFYGGVGEPYSKRGPLSAAQVDQLARHLPAVDPTLPSRIDGVDRALLDLLRLDGRTSTERLAAAAGTSTVTARRRLAELRTAGVLHLDVDVEMEVLDLPVQTLLWLTVGPRHLLAAGAALAGHPEVAFAAATTGSSNLFAAVPMPDVEATFRYLTTTVPSVAGIEAVSSVPVLRTVKAATTVLRPHRMS
ncbi:AsnC family transcriptional regulator [Pseudonocardia sp. CA-107938]|uniref:AsnC family transcriptional regulator n=1 Tax=Pseudonocardia sp. CA-107938 TaxID=3240021 RepID=UPI003D8BF230